MAFRYTGTNWAGIKWRTVGGITTLGQQIEQLRPGTHPADGTVASRRHDQINPRSDHSPDDGDVRAIDIGHNNFETLEEWAEQIRQSRDDRVKYVILGSVMFSSYSKGYIEAWTWRPYSGPYHWHMHVSLVSDGRCESTRPWQLEDDVAQFTDAEATALKAMVANMRAENSTPAYVTETIKLIRKERSLPLHAPESADVDDLTVRVESLEQFEQQVRAL
jgi:hypothetical protein